MIRHVNLYEPVLFTRVDFCCGTHEEMEEWLKKNKLGDPPTRFWDLRGFYTCFENKGKQQIKRVVWVHKASDFYALFHEVIHLIVDVFRDNGVAFDTHNEEMIAYYQTHWFRLLWHQMGLWNEEDIKNAKSTVKSKVGGTPADLKN